LRALRISHHCASFVHDVFSRRYRCEVGSDAPQRGKSWIVMGKPIFVLNGPNLNMLGKREPAIYGAETLDDVRRLVEDHAKGRGVSIDFRQTNYEGELVTWVQEARDGAAGIVVNAGAYTHTSVALLDALKAAERPVIEVHLSNIFARERFRHHSYVAPAAIGVICGFGPRGYTMAIDAMAAHIEAQPS
jgi:3-dehydroquinate dehydratase II